MIDISVRNLTKFFVIGENLLEDLSFDGFCEIPQLVSCTPEAILSRCGLPETVNAQKQAAKNQFAQLDGFLQM